MVFKNEICNLKRQVLFLHVKDCGGARLNQINKGGLGRTKGKPNPGRCGFASRAALPTGLSPEASPVGSLTAYQQRFAEALHLFAFPLFLGLLLHTPGPLRVRRLK